MLHGFPGTEMNFDLARAIQRAGWNVLAIEYRGVWGGGGKFSFSHTIEDAQAGLAWLRDPANDAKYLIDPKTIVVIGHSMGGFDTVMLSGDKQVAGSVVISGADIGGRLAEAAGKPIEALRERLGRRRQLYQHDTGGDGCRWRREPRAVELASERREARGTAAAHPQLERRPGQGRAGSRRRGDRRPAAVRASS